jgi:hypothetical protein
MSKNVLVILFQLKIIIFFYQQNSKQQFLPYIVCQKSTGRGGHTDRGKLRRCCVCTSNNSVFFIKVITEIAENLTYVLFGFLVYELGARTNGFLEFGDGNLLEQFLNCVLL